MKTLLLTLLACLSLTFSLSACLPEASVSVAPTTAPSQTATVTPTPTQTPTVVWFPPTETPIPNPTPVISPTQDMRPKLGNILVTDSFVSAQDWALASTTNGSVALSQNELTIAISHPNTYVSSVRQRPVLGDFYAEITAQLVFCQGVDEYGLLIRVNSADDFYRFVLSCNGQARLDRLAGGGAYSPVPWTSSSIFPIGAPSSQRLAVWAVGNEMRFFINDQYQFTLRDPLFPTGAIGVFARSADSDNLTVNFSDLTIREINP